MAPNTEYAYLSYKLLPDGSIFRVDPGDIASQFININIIACYFFSQRRLYIWIGDSVSRELQNQIPHIERQILDRNPNITILRHFTIEGVKGEAQEFINLMHIPFEEFENQLSHWDTFHTSTIERIRNLQTEIEELKTSNEFGRIKEIANQILTLAGEISDEQVVQEYEALISTLFNQEEEEKEGQIRHTVEKYAQIFHYFHQNHEFQKAKEILDEITKKLVDSEDRGLIRKWKYFYIKLEQDEELYLASLKKEEQIAENLNQNELILELQSKIEAEWANSQWREGYDHTVQIIRLLKKIGRFEEIGKYNKRKFGFEEKIEETLENDETLTEKDDSIKVEINSEIESNPQEEVHSKVIEESISEGDNILDQIQENIENNYIKENDEMFIDFSKQVEDLDEQKNYSAAVEICNKILEILHLTSHNSEMEIWETRKNLFYEKLEIMLKQNTENERLNKSYNELLFAIADDEENASWNYGIGHCREILVVLASLGREPENRQWLQKQKYFEQKLKDQKLEHQILEEKYKELSNNSKTCQNAEQWDSALDSIDEILLFLSSLNRDSERAGWESQKESILDKISKDKVRKEAPEENEATVRQEDQGQKLEEIQSLSSQKSPENPLFIEYSHLKDQVLAIHKNQYWSEGIENCIRILEILPEISRNEEISHFKALKSEFEHELQEETTAQDYSYYDKVDVAQYSSEEVNLQKYPELLRQANTIESSQKKASKEILLRCLAIIKADEDQFILSFPKRKMDRKTLEIRLAKIAKM